MREIYSKFVDKGDEDRPYVIQFLLQLAETHAVAPESLIIREYFNKDGKAVGQIVFTTQPKASSKSKKRLSEAEIDSLTGIGEIICAKDHPTPRIYREHRLGLAAIAQPLTFPLFRTEVIQELEKEGHQKQHIVYSIEDLFSKDTTKRGYIYKAQPLSRYDNPDDGLKHLGITVLYSFDYTTNTHHWRVEKKEFINPMMSSKTLREAIEIFPASIAVFRPLQRPETNEEGINESN